ncbi:MAG: hypothetical protein IT428_31660, partial [Planctomycetaceae bacterium]|nr:hypothetical protein [Planctomycetaceae bacterium]
MVQNSMAGLCEDRCAAGSTHFSDGNSEFRHFSEELVAPRQRGRGIVATVHRTWSWASRVLRVSPVFSWRRWLWSLSSGNWLGRLKFSLANPGRRRRTRSVARSAAAVQCLESRVLLAAAPVGLEFRVNTFATGAQNEPSIAMDADGDFAVVWTSTPDPSLFPGGYGIFVQRYDANGNALGGQSRVNTSNFDPQVNSSIAMDADGDFVVTWTSFGLDGGGDGIYAQQYTANGIAVGGWFRVNTWTTGHQSMSRVAMDAGGNFVITWTSEGQDGSGDGIYAQRFLANGDAVGGEFRVNTQTNEDQFTPGMAMNADGDFVIVWSGGREDGRNHSVSAQRFDADGNAVGVEFEVNTGSPDLSLEPSVAIGSGGDFVVTWNSSEQDGSGFGINARRFDANGLALGGEFRVNTWTSADQFGSTVAIDADGDFVVAWSSRNQEAQESGVGDGIYAQRYNANGNVVGDEFLVNTYTTHDQTNPALAMRANGDFVIAWTSLYQDFEVDGVYAQRFVAGSDPGGSAPTAIALSSLTVTEDAAAGELVGTLSATDADPGETFTYELISGPGDTHNDLFAIIGNELRVVTALNLLAPDTLTVRVRATDSTGLPFERSMTLTVTISNPFGRELRINRWTTGNQQFSAVAMSAAGDFVAVWEGQDSAGQDGNNRGVFARRFDALGNPFTDEFRVNALTTGFQGSPAVAMDSSGDFVVVWTSQSQDGDGFGVYARRFETAGTPLGDEFLVNVGTTGNQSSPSISMNASGDFVISWGSAGVGSNGGDIYARRYAANGDPLSGEFRVNALTALVDFTSSVAIDSEGDFVVTFTADSQDLGAEDIYARRYDASGNALGNEFRVNTSTGGMQLNSRIATDAVGNFVIAWETLSDSGGATYEIQARRFGADGSPLGDDFRVNTLTTAHQNHVDLAMDAAGSFVITWTSTDQNQDGSGSAVFARRYGADGAPLSGDFRLNLSSLDGQHHSRVAMNPEGDLVFTWGSFSRDGSSQNDIQARRYGPGSAPTEIVVSPASVSRYANGGRFIGSFGAASANPGEIFTYSLVNGAGDAQNSFFAISGFQLLAAGSLSSLTSETASIRVRATDPAGYSFEQALTIELTNINEAPAIAPLSGISSLSEAASTSARRFVLQFSVIDDGLGINVLSLSGDDAGLFEINGNQVFLRAGVRLDFETNPRLDFTIEVDDSLVGNWPDSSHAVSIALTDVVEAATVIGGFSGSLAYKEDAAPVVVAPGVTITDRDSMNFAFGVLTLRITQNGEAADRLGVRHQGNAVGQIGVVGSAITFGGVTNVIGTFAGGAGSTPLTIDLAAACTQPALKALIQNLTYADVADVPLTSPRRVELTVRGGDGMLSAVSFKTIAVTPTNDVPTVGSFGGTTSFLEAGGSVLVDADASVADPDSANFDTGKLTIRISANGHADDRLTIRHEGTGAGQVDVQTVGTVTNVTFGGVLIGTLTGGTGMTPLVVTFKTAANAAAVQAVLRNLLFSNVSTAPTTLARTLQATLTDGDGGTSPVASKTVSVQAVNTPPTVVVGAGINFARGGAPVLIAAMGTVADPDSANFNGGRLTVQMTANAEATDQLRIVNQGTGLGKIGLSGSNVTFSGTVIGTWTGGDGNMPLVITFTSNAV